MNFADLLNKAAFDPSKMIVLRHRPSEPQLNKVFPWLAAERPELYNAYQQTQGERLERVMLGCSLIASFIGHCPGAAVFIGFYEIGSTTALTYDDYWEMPEYRELANFGMIGFRPTDLQKNILKFELSLLDAYSHWKGKLVVGWPPPERSWWRRAHKNYFPILAIHEDSLLDQHMPVWDEIDLTWEELAVLPSRWRLTLS